MIYIGNGTFYKTSNKTLVENVSGNSVFRPIPACYFGRDAACDLRSYVTKLFPTNIKLSAVVMSLLLDAPKKTTILAFFFFRIL